MLHEPIKQGYKLTEIGVIPDNWEVKKIGDVCGFIVPGRNKPKIFNGNIPWITTPDLEDGRIVNCSKSSLKVSLNEVKSIGSKIVPKGSVLMSCVGELGITAVTDCEIVINQQLHAFLPSKLINKFFLAYIIKNQLKYIYSVATKTAVPYLNKDNCNSILIPVPPIEQQEKIAEVLTDIDELIESLEELINKKRLIKQGAMQELLTGKRRLKGFGENKGYKQTELGLIPEDWELFFLPQLTYQKDDSIKIGPFGSALKKEYLQTQGYKVYGQENIYLQNMQIGDRFISQKHFQKLKSCEIKQGDFLISMMGTVGKCFVVSSPIQKGIMDSHLLRIRFDFSKLEIKFIRQIFETSIIFEQIKKLSVGGIMEGLSSKIIKSLKIILPPTKEEQGAIASILTDMDREIEGLEGKLEKYRQIKEGMMEELLTGKIRL